MCDVMVHRGLSPFFFFFPGYFDFFVSGRLLRPFLIFVVLILFFNL